MNDTPLSRCANGCDRPPDPPSLVICKECQEAITEKLAQMLRTFEPEGMEMKLNLPEVPECQCNAQYLCRLCIMHDRDRQITKALRELARETYEEAEEFDPETFTRIEFNDFAKLCEDFANQLDPDKKEGME